MLLCYDRAGKSSATHLAISDYLSIYIPGTTRVLPGETRPDNRQSLNGWRYFSQLCHITNAICLLRLQEELEEEAQAAAAAARAAAEEERVRLEEEALADMALVECNVDQDIIRG
eukprot:4168455-Pyramimonas_sp.AAC.1